MRIITKQNISLHVAQAYIEGLNCSACDLLNDVEYAKAFRALEKRVSELLETPEQRDIIDAYVVVECEE